jgi:hypothetical protein
LTKTSDSSSESNDEEVSTDLTDGPATVGLEPVASYFDRVIVFRGTNGGFEDDEDEDEAEDGAADFVGQFGEMWPGCLQM